jgi:hypothetical protein
VWDALGGNACGALSAAIWMRMLAWCRENPGETPPFLNNPIAKKLIKKFKKATNSEMLCRNISGKDFSDIDDHSAYIHSGGCKELIEVLALT